MVRSYLAILLIILSSQAFAMRRSTNPIAERFVLTGEISSSTKASKGIVMLHDKQARKNIFVKVGAPLPGMPRWKISQVTKDQAVATDGLEDLVLKRDKFFTESSPGSSRSSQASYDRNDYSNYAEEGDVYDDNTYSDDQKNYGNNAVRTQAKTPYRTDVAPPPSIPLNEAYFPDDDFDGQ